MSRPTSQPASVRHVLGGLPAPRTRDEPEDRFFEDRRMGLVRRTVEIVRGDEKLQRRLLQVVFDRFHQTGEWPSVDVLRYELDLEDDDLDVATVGQRLEPALGRLESGYQARASLTIHGLALCSGADQELTDTLQTMRYAYARFRANGPGARFDSEGLSRDLGFDAIRIRRTYELIQWFPGIGGGGAVSPDDWYREILPDITRFKHVESVADLLAAVPRPGGPTVPASGSLGSTRAPRRTSTKGARPSVLGVSPRVV